MSIEFSANISALRRDRGLSQKQAAQELGISQALLSHYEKGIRECNLDFVKKAADYYDVTADYLLGMTDSRHRSDDLFDPGTIAGDRRTQPGSVLRCLAYLARQAENAGETERAFFADFFALCVKKYLSACEGSDVLSRLCDISVNKLCGDAPHRKAEEDAPLFLKTVGEHAALLLNNDVSQALQ